jgi:hypothetical protein
MNNSGGMSSDECGGDLDCDVECLDELQSLQHALAECETLDELGSNESRVFRAADLVNSKDVWVVES